MNRILYIKLVCSIIAVSLISISAKTQNNNKFDWAYAGKAIDSNSNVGIGGTGSSLAADDAGNTYVIGNFNNPNQTSWPPVHFVLSGDTVTSNVTYSGNFIAKYNSDGDLAWMLPGPRHITTGSMGAASKVLVQNDTSLLIFYIGGGTTDWTYDGDTLFAQSGNRAGLLLSINPTDGSLNNYQWIYGQFYECFYIGIDDSSNVFLGATYRSIIISGTTYYSMANNASESDRGVVLLKMDSELNLIWFKRSHHSPSGYETWVYANACQDNQGYLYLYISHGNRVPNHNLTFGGNTLDNLDYTGRKYYIIKLDPTDGSMVWTKSFKTSWPVSSGNNYPGRMSTGPILAIDSILYVTFNPLFYYIGSLYVDENLPVGFSMGSGQNGSLSYHSIIGEYNLNNGNYINHHLIQTPEPYGAWQTVKVPAGTVRDNKAIFTVVLPTFSIDSQTVSYPGAQNVKAITVLEFDPQQQEFSIYKRVGEGYGSYSTSINVAEIITDANGDLCLTGNTDQPIDFDDALHQAPQYNGRMFIAKLSDCSYLDAQVTEVNGNNLCNASSITLNATVYDGASYQWMQNGFLLTSQQDTTLTATVSGNYQVIIYDDNGCIDTSTVFVATTTSTAGTSLSLAQDSACSNEEGFLLNGGYPSGGFYYGTGVTSNNFDPSGLSIGSYNIYYQYTDSLGCMDTAVDVMHINPAPYTVFYSTYSTLCTGDTITLTGGYPSGGTYSGPGVSGGQFFTSTAGAGTHTLYYTKTNTYGCSAMDSISVTVNQGPNVSLNIATTNLCNSASPLLLTGQSPTGGTFSGTGVSGNYFIPQIVDPGDHVITYSKTQNGCTGTATDHIFVDSMPLAAISALDTICVSATAWSLSGGSPAGGTYSGTGVSSGAINASIPGIGTSTVYYSFTNSCGTSTTDTTIAIIASPTISASASNASCFGFDDGSLSATISGGFGPYAYAWSSGDTTSNASSLLAGTYTLSVSGDRGCAASNSFSVAQPAVLALNIDSVDDVVCNGFSNGQAFVNTAGGTATYSYLWSTGATSEDVFALGSGTHSLTVTDAQGCQDSLSVGVLELNPIVPLSSFTNLTCFESNNGTASVAVSGGGGTYTYAWNSGSTSNALSSLSAGTYVLTVIDQNSCTAMDTVVVDQPDSLEISNSVTDVSCFAASDGAIATTAQGGTGSYSYAWNNGASTANLSGLTSGTYVLTLTDANGCTATMSALADQPDSLDISFSVSQAILCFGNNNGAISATVTGGSQPYTYSWSGGGSSATKSGIAAGTYTVSVTDINGCSKSMSHVLTQPTQLTLSIDSLDHANCFGTATAFVSVAASGGTGTLAYNWSNSATTPSISNLSAGTYSITVTDANSCTATAIASITQPAQINLGLSSTNVSCFGGSTGQINTNVTNNQGAASYAWSNGSTSASITALTAGSYGITVTDAAGCTRTGNRNITQPTALTAALTNQNLNCHGDASGAIAASASGGTGTKTFAWNTGASTSTISGLSAGTYAVTVTDALGCTHTSTSTITEPAVLVLSLSAQTNLTCFNNASGVAQFSATGGTANYTYTWSDNGSGASRTGLNAATYTVTVSDNNNCTASTTVTLTQPTQLIINIDSSENVLCNGDNNGAIYASAAGGTGSISYVWSSSQTTQNISALTAGTYTISATDANNCTTTVTHTVTQPQVLDAYILTQNDVLCYGDSTGMIEVDGAGGTEPFHFLWNDGDTNNYRNTLLSGLYLISITDSNGCTDTVSNFIAQSDSIEIIVSSLQHNPCFGGSLGTILVFGQGGSGTFNNYLWSNGSANVALNGLSAGNYTVTVTDTYNCTKARTITVNEPQALTLSAILTMANCDNTNDGQITVDVDGGTLPYVLAWNTGASDTVINALDSGTYTVLITDSHNCTLMDTFTLGFDHIAPNPGLGPDTTVCEFSGFTLDAYSTGTMYSWTSGETTVSIPINSTGTYAVTATDTFGCAGSDTVLISVNAAPAFTLSNDTLMCGATLAEQGLAIHGPVGMSAYNWSSGATTQIDTARSAGSYVLVVTDSNGCSFADSMIIAYDTCLGVSSAGGPAISIYPNPTFGEFTIETTHADLLDISIYSTAGRLVSHFTLTDRKLISLEAFGAGIYHLSVTTSIGNTSFFKVVVL